MSPIGRQQGPKEAHAEAKVSQKGPKLRPQVATRSCKRAQMGAQKRSKSEIERFEKYRLVRKINLFEPGAGVGWRNWKLRGNVGRRRDPNGISGSIFGALGVQIGACWVAMVRLEWPSWGQEAPG